jgi:hypothetical protein
MLDGGGWPIVEVRVVIDVEVIREVEVVVIVDEPEVVVITLVDVEVIVVAEVEVVTAVVEVVGRGEPAPLKRFLYGEEATQFWKLACSGSP